MRKRIYCLGGANIDCKLQARDALTPGTSNPVFAAKSLGGVARNVAENLAHWTQHIYLQTIVGNDEAGKEILRYMEQLGVDIGHCMVMPNADTAHYYAILNPNGGLDIAYADMAIYDQIPLTAFMEKWNWPHGSIVFIDTNFPIALINQAISTAKQKQVHLCIDPVSVAKANKLPLNLEHVFLLKPNLFEARALTHLPLASITDCLKAADILHARGSVNVIITLGEDGFVIVNQELRRHVKTKSIKKIKDANGAGDAFCAGLLFGLQQNLPLLDACQIGAAAAQETVKTFDTVCHQRKEVSRANIF